MNLKFEKGNLVVDFHELLSCIDPEHRPELVESLACDDEIIRHVAAQIISRWTDNCWSGGSYVTAYPDDGTPLDRAWREVAKRSGEVAKREIERLEEALRQKTEECRMAHDEIYRLRNKNSY